MKRIAQAPCLKTSIMRYASSAAVTSLALVAGCANMVTAPGVTSLVQGATVSGKIHGGNQPVGFATVQIYTIGQTGVGSAGTLLATTTTDAGGNFSFNKQTSGSYSNTGNTYTCPSTAGTGDSQLYIISRGGNTTGAGGSSINNSAAIFLAPLGYCASVSNSQFVDISEVTTAATVAALAQFINPATEMIGNDGIGVAYQAIQNAVNTIPNLVSLASGLANSSVTLTAATGGSGVTGATVTATPEAAKLNTIANILSSCINQVSATSASNCSTLFSAAVPPANVARTSQPGGSFPAASDTLQAALYMFLNPTDGSTANRTTLFNLSPATGAPFQPTITAVPTDWTIGISYASTSTCGSGTLLNRPYDVKFDLVGNAWVANAGGSLVELTANGVPTTCVPLGGNGVSTTVDTAGNVWYADSTGFVYRYSPTTNTTRTYSVGGQPLAITSNSVGDIFYTSILGGSGDVFQIVNGANATGANAPILISNAVGPNPAAIFPDSSYDLWVTSGAGYATFISPATSGTNFMNGYTSTPYTVQSPTYGVTVGPSYRAYITSRDPSATVTVLAPTSGTYAIATGFPTAANAGGLSNPTGISLDGALNSWIGNGAAETVSARYALSVIAVDGTAVTANGNTNGGFQKPLQYLNAVRATTVDSAGNVWTVNDGNVTSITELVGSAVPVYQPYSRGLADGRFQQIP